MASLFRPCVAAASASSYHLPLLRTFASTPLTLAFNRSGPSSAGSRQPLGGFNFNLNVDSVPTSASLFGNDESAPDHQFKWWQDASKARSGATPNTAYTTRSFTVQKGKDGGTFQTAYNGLSATLRRARLRPYLRRCSVYEKPSEKRVRLNSQKHRKKFKAMVREKVQLVNLYQSRR